MTIEDRIRKFFNVYFRRRIPFNYGTVVGDWQIEGAGIAHFSARLYCEVKLLKKAIGNFRAEKSLEIGCGYGRLTGWISEYSQKHYAIEPEPTLLTTAKQLYPNVEFHLAKAQKLPFPDCYFDLCVSWTVLQHIPPQELEKAINEINRVCKKDAVIIIAEEVGQKTFIDHWQHTLQEWQALFKPRKLEWYTERRIEETYQGIAGFVMRFG